MDEIDSIGSSRLEGGSGGMISHILYLTLNWIFLVAFILVNSTIIDRDMYNPERPQI